MADIMKLGIGGHVGTGASKRKREAERMMLLQMLKNKEAVGKAYDEAGNVLSYGEGYAPQLQDVLMGEYGMGPEGYQSKYMSTPYAQDILDEQMALQNQMAANLGFSNSGAAYGDLLDLGANVRMGLHDKYVGGVSGLLNRADMFESGKAQRILDKAGAKSAINSQIAQTLAQGQIQRANEPMQKIGMGLQAAGMVLPFLMGPAGMAAGAAGGMASGMGGGIPQMGGQNYIQGTYGPMQAPSLNVNYGL